MKAAYVASIHWDGSGVTLLGDGQGSKFGFCVCGQCDVDIRVDLAGVLGELHAEAKVCWLRNLSRYASLVLWDLEDPRQRLRLPPGRSAVPIPFELARVGVAGAGEAGLLTIIGPEPAVHDLDVRPCDAEQTPPALDPTATYYAVLQVLCAGWADSAHERLPSSAEVASTLRSRGLAISSGAVDHHIDYLIRRTTIGQSGPSRKREALVRLCIEQGWLDRSIPQFNQDRNG